MYAWLVGLVGLRPIPRRGDVTDRAAMLALSGRFVDELGSGLPLVLLPTLQRRLGLSVAQTGWCLQALYGAAAVVEPVAAAAVDLVVPVTVAVAPVWPLVRARALAAVPGRGGAAMAITSLYGVLPLPALFGWSGGRVGLTPTMLAVHTAATLGILAAVRRARDG